jgi:hypothetical protein
LVIHYIDKKNNIQQEVSIQDIFKDEAQTVLFKDPVRTAL